MGAYNNETTKYIILIVLKSMQQTDKDTCQNSTRYNFVDLLHNSSWVGRSSIIDLDIHNYVLYGTVE